jgi:hypothetical protein
LTLFALIFTIFLCFNLSRYFVISAVSRLAWRALTPAGFVFVGTCRHNGELDDKYRSTLKKNVHRSVRAYEAQAIMLFILSILSHFPYIIWIIFLTDSFGLGKPTARQPNKY